MADVFKREDALKLLKNKHIALFGDSNVRATYKDLVWLLSNGGLIDQTNLRKKQELSFSGDKLGKHSELNHGRGYEEERSFKKAETRVDFYFITRCYNLLLEDMMEDINLGLRDAPDVIYINSTLWDVCRWGPNGVIEFKENLQKLARLFKNSLPEKTLVIWATALPLSPQVNSSLLLKQINFLGYTLRFDVMEANQFARHVMGNHGFDVLDNHFYMRMQIHRRVKDGIHYFPVAVRLLTNLLLTHLALSWDFPLPNRVETILLEKAKAQMSKQPSSPTPQLVSPQVLSDKAKKSTEGKTQGPAKKRGQERKNGQYSRQQRAQQKPVNTPPSRPARVKSNRGRGKWSQNKQRGWQRVRSNTPPPIHGSGTYINPWANNFQPPNWSEDQWSEGQMFQNGQRFGNEQRFANDQRFSSEQRFINELRFTNEQRFQNDQRFVEESRFQASSILAQAMMQRMATRPAFKSSRYAPY
ncbi:PC-esterase domain-containing protein 1A-like [Homalodisca vitripennis]|uniref:PC-esterase domain-containing protein 1A n=1 Tax=Homalodisca liturata TaxID=320908 RepID=A0A1B6JD90_9HEMI|nr:PC-esterase domain-containing protein 1A-like [Homalodisca vitripennis]XP_046685346.1 PC-esterase domain-containing protein 1A-like [Homalodisca vitripennis]